MDRAAVEGRRPDICKDAISCANCKGPHPAYSRSCTLWRQEKEILSLGAKEGLSYPEAKQRFSFLSKGTYSDAVRRGPPPRTESKATQVSPEALAQLAPPSGGSTPAALKSQDRQATPSPSEKERLSRPNSLERAASKEQHSSRPEQAELKNALPSTSAVSSAGCGRGLAPRDPSRKKTLAKTSDTTQEADLSMELDDSAAPASDSDSMEWPTQTPDEDNGQASVARTPRMAVGGINEYRLSTNVSWDEYVERLEMYCVANSLTTPEQKRAVLLSCREEETYSLIVTLVKPTSPTAPDYITIVTAVKAHLHPRPSELYARFLFYKRDQHAGETVADYVTALRKLAEDCVQQRLLAERNLTFDVAYDLAVTAEATSQQQRDIRKQRQQTGKVDSDGPIQATTMKPQRQADSGNCHRCTRIELHGIRHLSTSDEALTAQFSEVFRTDLPRFKGAPIHIELNDVQPKVLKSRPVPFALREDVTKELDRLQKQGGLGIK
ncbi:hypothetical protein HPB47_001139 [Ixodes persulcatus]|uniref:Uncharacterized protein n=1 Tax=Ixodes persulcatus TaxID=34615 RepID=A0AC60PQK3_IXOPE|nr:hypothetical protein HPB47_001139 [Ixodes persulcatus]